jgi:hypothetical protein
MSSSLISALSNPPEANSAVEKKTGKNAEGDSESIGPAETEDITGLIKKEPAQAAEQQVSPSLSQNSLVPADDNGMEYNDGQNDDDSSYIQVNRSGIASSPCSLKSVEDLILVNRAFAGGNQ